MIKPLAVSRSQNRDQPISVHSAQPNRRKCKFKARALYMRNGCRGIQEFVVEVNEISRTQLVLTSNFSSLMPDNFTLILGARQYGIGCAVYSRVESKLNCNLLKPESTEMVAYLAGLRDPNSTIEEIRHPLFPRSLMVKR